MFSELDSEQQKAFKKGAETGDWAEAKRKIGNAELKELKVKAGFKDPDSSGGQVGASISADKVHSAFD